MNHKFSVFSLYFLFLLLVVFAAATLFVTTAHAAFVSDRLDPIQPQKGMYYDRNQSGSGLSVDFGPDGLMFLQFATYDSAGNQVNYITQPNYVPSSEATRAATGVLGTATSQAFYVTGGQCPGCPYVSPVIHPLPLNPVFTWMRPRHVDMTFQQNGQTFTYHFDAGNYEGKPDDEFLPGTWLVQDIEDDRPFVPSQPTVNVGVAVMRVAQAPFTTVKLAPGAAADIVLPPAGARFYTFTCAGSQDGTDNSACASLINLFGSVGGYQSGYQAMLWFDPATNKAGFDSFIMAADGSAQIGPANYHSELYITPNLIQAHLQMQGQPAIAVLHDGDIPFAITLTRLPANAVRSCYDYGTQPSSTCH